MVTLDLDQLELWDHPPGGELEAIADQWLTIARAYVVGRGPESRPYRRLVLELADGRRVETSARQLVDRLGSAPPDVFPFRAMLTLRPSRRHPDRTYWTVVFPGDVPRG